MYSKVQYWIRTLCCTLLALIINQWIDIQLNVAVGSGRDWLLFFTIYGVLFYLFVWRWAHYQINKRDEENKK